MNSVLIITNLQPCVESLHDKNIDVQHWQIKFGIRYTTAYRNLFKLTYSRLINSSQRRMNVERILEPFPAKEATKPSMASSTSTSTTTANDTMRFHPKFNNLPAPSGEICDSGIASVGSEFCLSGGLESIQDDFQKLRLGATVPEEPSVEPRVEQKVQVEANEEHEPQLTADAFDQDQEGDTPLHLAIIHEDDVSLQFIKYAPSEHLLNIANNLYQTPLHLAVHTKQHRVCRALAVAGAPLETVDRDGNTALHLACRHGNSECAKLLTTRVMAEDLKTYCRRDRPVAQLPQNLELRNFDGLTCMHLAAQSKNFHLVCYLRSIGAQIDAPDGKSGRTALHHAVEANDFNLVQYLISLHANVNALTFDLCSPLHLAVGRGFQRIMLLLLEHGADISALNTEGLTPADLATTQHQRMFLNQQPEYNDFQL